MKNRNKLRTINIDGARYLWSYNFDDMDFINYPYSYYLFVPENNKKLKIRVYFTKYAPNMNLDAYSDDGTPCLCKGEKIILNLCRPFFARQMIEYVFSHCCSPSASGEINIADGDSLLTAMGYENFF